MDKLASAPELKPAFLNPHTGKPKSIACIRVDGAGDEGPGHLEVQYWWTLHHLKTPTQATLVTARNSGSSYLNRVELHNGCLSLAHSNLFIPSTLNGSCYVGSQIDEQKLAQNLTSAAEVYIERCNKAPCGDAEIHLYIGADSSERQCKTEMLLKYLKGSRKEKAKLQSEHPQCYSEFEKVWSIRERHMRKDVPVQYVFCLLPCYSEECCHPICEAGKPVTAPSWFEGGPPLSYLPFPVLDATRVWGDVSCDKCAEVCCGHYLKPESAYMSSQPSIVEPPSHCLLEMHKALCGPASSDAVLAKAKQLLLSVDDVKFWLEHLETIQQNRREGARKAAATRKKKQESTRARNKQVSECRCGVCDHLYEDETELWIACDRCQCWFHGGCVGVAPDAIPNEFMCCDCM